MSYYSGGGSASASGGGGEMGAGSMFYGDAMDILKMKFAQEYRGQDRKSEQDFAVGMQTWHNQREDTAVQRRMNDLQAAGLNPILAAGGASQGAGSSGSGQSAGGGGNYSGHRGRDFAEQYLASQQAALTASQADLNTAAAEKARAEARNVSEQVPTHEVTRDKMRQEITQSVQMVKTLAAQAEQSTSSAGAQRELAEKLKAELPQIAAAIKLMQEQSKEIAQRSKQNLPEVEKRLKEAEAYIKNLQTPQHQRMAESWGANLPGTLGALARVLNPFADLLK